jgi:two-component system, LuxR family, response regulator FixJ
MAATGQDFSRQDRQERQGPDSELSEFFLAILAILARAFPEVGLMPDLQRMNESRRHPDSLGMKSGQVFLIDDDSCRRDTFAAVLARCRYALQTFDDAPTFLGTVDYEQIPAAACVVAPLNLAPLNGVELLDVLHADRVRLPAILFGASADLPLAIKAMRYSASHVLWQPFSTSLLLDVIAGVLREWSACSALVAGQSNRELQRVEDRVATLSKRQRQVLRHVVAGDCNRQIAVALGISVKTVELHRACMMRKMQADSLIALFRMMSTARLGLEQHT